MRALPTRQGETLRARPSLGRQRSDGATLRVLDAQPDCDDSALSAPGGACESVRKVRWCDDGADLIQLRNSVLADPFGVLA
jgi:hypothetical protein